MIPARAQRLMFVVFAALALALAFAIHAKGEWLWDDVYLVEQNPQLRGPLGPILRQDMWGGATGNPQQIYRPVPMTLLWLEARILGVDVARMRLVNLLVHALSGGLLYLVLRRQKVREGPAAFAALVFLVHPTATEPVMWISGLHDLLGVTFALGAWLAWTSRWRTSLRVAVGSLLTALAFLAKEPYVVVVVLLALEVAVPFVAAAPGGGREASRAPAGLLGPLAAVLAVFTVRSRLGIGSGSAQSHAPLVEHARNYATIVVHYVAQLVTFTNGRTTEAYRPLTTTAALACCLVLVALLIAIMTGLRRRVAPVAMPVFSRGVLWILVALAPHVLALPLIGMFGNRYGYLPLVGFALVVAAAADRVTDVAVARSPRLGRLLPLPAGAFVAFLALLTSGEATLWTSAAALFGADVAAAPNDPRALYHYGYAVNRRAGCGEAIPLYARAVAADPGYQRAWHNLAGCLVNEQAFADAIAPARRALALATGDDATARAELNLAVALAGLNDPAARTEAARLLQAAGARRVSAGTARSVAAAKERL